MSVARYATLAAVLLLSTACSPPRTSSPSAPDAQQGVPSVVAADTVYDFGAVMKGTKVAHTFRIENAGDAELVIEKVVVQELFTTLRAKPAVPAGGQTEVTITFDSSKWNGLVATGAVLHTNDPSRPTVVLRMTGRVKGYVDVLPRPALFITTFKGTAGEASALIVSNEGRPLRITRVDSKSDRFRVRIDTVERGRRYRLVATSSGRAAVGRSKDTVRLLTNSARQPVVTVAVYVLVREDVYLFPDQAEVAFGRLSIAALRQDPKMRDALVQTFLLKARQGRALQVVRVTTDVDVIDVRRDPPSGESGTHQFEVQLNPARLRPGPLRGTIRIETDNREFPVLTVPVTGDLY